MALSCKLLRNFAQLPHRYAMQQHLLYALFLFCLFTGCNSSSETPESVAEATPTDLVEEPVDNTLTEAEKADGWALLFDGESTTQWKGYNRDSFPNQGWRVEDGILMVEHTGTEEAGFGGDIITRESFENFELKLDFALADTSNSGIFYLVQEVEGTPIWHSAPEYQLLDDETYKVIYDGLTDMQLTGANYDLHAQKENFSRPIGDWNTARIIKNGDHVEHWLNGKLVVAYNLGDEDWQARYKASKFKEYPSYASVRKGPIGLQDHGHLCQFKNLKIKRLP